MLDALLIGSCLVAHPLFVASSSAQQQTKPNILFVLADNIGHGDLGVYGGGELRGAPTPRIDRLAAEGLRLTQFLVEPSCTPSRAALLTGRYSIRSGLSLVAVEGTDISLPAKEITMAEMLHDAGYATAIFGKWHLGAQSYSQPQNKGFDALARARAQQARSRDHGAAARRHQHGAAWRDQRKPKRLRALCAI
ncbi:sulfatase-like hydrolase/transferase [Bradyrhizobium sp. LA7.1]|uniref:sulfatase-like hydrolase/transferase n=1 Tax=Bradyrhizobium sp. LA7.1 TaxID=3156324 RepID=UPI003395B6D5